MAFKTIENYFLDKLQDNFLSEEQATAILDDFKKSAEGKNMKTLWNDKTNEHPRELGVVAWMGIKATASTWLAENKPNHFARPMFELS